MNENNQTILRTSANQLIQAVGSSPMRVQSLLPIIDAVMQQVQQCLLTRDAYSQYLGAGNGGEEINAEKKRIAMRLNGFDAKENRAWAEITRRFGADVKQGELNNIAQIIAQNAKIKLDRDAKRRKCVLLKWFDENWEKIYPFLDYIVLGPYSDNDEPQEQQIEGKQEK